MSVNPVGSSSSHPFQPEHKSIILHGDNRINSIWGKNITPSEMAKFEKNIKKLNSELTKQEGIDNNKVQKLIERLENVFIKFNCQNTQSKISLIRDRFHGTDAIVKYLETNLLDSITTTSASNPLSPKYAKYFSSESREHLENAGLEKKWALSFLFDERIVPFGMILKPSVENEIKSELVKNPKYDHFAQVYQECRAKLNEQIKDFSTITTETYENDDPRKALSNLEFQNANLEKSQSSCGGAYFLKSDNKLAAIVKPCSEDVGGIDNKKGYASPFFTQNFTRPVDNYSSAAREAFAYELAHEIGYEGCIPPTILEVVENPNFHSYFDHPQIKEALSLCPEHVSTEIIALLGGRPSPIRLCSIQQAVNDARELNDILLNWNEMSEKPVFNQARFEDVMFMTRLLGETDGHPSNYLCTEENGEWLLTKIDSGFCMPNRNFSFSNCLTSLPNAREPISNDFRNRIISFGEKTNLLDTLGQKYKLGQDAINTAKERAAFMKALIIKYPHITHREFELRLRLFSGIGYDKFNETYENRKLFALQNYTRAQLKEFKKINRTQFRVADSQVAHEQVRAGGLVKNVGKLKKEEQRIQVEDDYVPDDDEY